MPKLENGKKSYFSIFTIKMLVLSFFSLQTLYVGPVIRVLTLNQDPMLIFESTGNSIVLEDVSKVSYRSLEGAQLQVHQHQEQEHELADLHHLEMLAPETLVGVLYISPPQQCIISGKRPKIFFILHLMRAHQCLPCRDGTAVQIYTSNLFTRRQPETFSP